jgi:hypothetical protein
MAKSTPRPRRRGLRSVALLCTALLSCTTVRTHVSAVPGEVLVQDGRVEPEVELWVEGNRPLGEEEAARYRAEVKAALARALAGRDQPDGDALLVVRTQGVTRTPGRRHDQVAAGVGLAVGVVVVVAAVVLAVVYGGKGGSGGGHHVGGAGPAHGSSGGHGQAVAVRPPRIGPPRFTAAPRPLRPAPIGLPPRPGPAPARPSVPAPRPPPVLAGPFPGPWHTHGHDHGPDVWLGLDLWWPMPAEPAPAPAYLAPPPDVAPPDDEAAMGPGDEVAAAAPEAEQEPAPGPERLSIPPPPPLPVEDRDFFDGDRLKVEALVVDRHTGEVLWTKQVSRNADPRDPKEVEAAVDALLREGGWKPPSA